VFLFLIPTHNCSTETKEILNGSIAQSERERGERERKTPKRIFGADPAKRESPKTSKV